MHIIEILLPVQDNVGGILPPFFHNSIREVLVGKFGGITAYTQAPAQGVWANNGEKVREPIIVLEVMTDNLDERWWAAFRKQLEEMLQQEEVVIRSHEAKRL